MAILTYRGSPMASTKSKHHPPYTLALIICDQIYADPSTGKMTILGTFTTIGARRFPAVHPSMAVYLAVTDGRGKCPIRVRLIDVDEEREPIFTLDGEVEFKDPRGVVEMPFQTPPLTFPEPGEYRLQLFCGDEPLMERRMVLFQLGQE